jgi:predicted aspartyl protease
MKREPVVGYERRFFGQNGELWFEIQVVALLGEDFFVEALFDTGFLNGWLVINSQDLDALGWTLITAQVDMRTAQGESEFNLHEGKVIIDDTQYIIPVHVGDDVPETIMGSGWLNVMELIAKKPKGILRLERISEE